MRELNQNVRVLILSDIHANLEAFQAVLDHAQNYGPVDAVWCCGDIVGYGPNPGPCIDLLASLPNLTVAGNHDLAAVHAIGLERFNPLAAAALRWTAAQLTSAHQAWLLRLPSTVTQGFFTLVHGSPLDPVWDYVLPGVMHESALRAVFATMKTPHGTCTVQQGLEALLELINRMGPKTKLNMDLG